MKTFKNIKIGVLETVNDKLAEQYEARPELYELVNDKEETNEMTLKELKERADELGIEYPSKVTKSALLKLIEEKEISEEKE